jgi:DNA-directed RNA polymerase subunit alpha
MINTKRHYVTIPADDYRKLIELKELVDKEKFEEIYYKKITDVFDISVRSHNALKNADIIYIRDLIQLTDYELLRKENFGRKSLNEIKEYLNSENLKLGTILSDNIKNKKLIS